jgi:hypothetical protein
MKGGVAPIEVDEGVLGDVLKGLLIDNLGRVEDSNDGWVGTGEIEVVTLDIVIYGDLLNLIPGGEQSDLGCFHFAEIHSEGSGEQNCQP